MKKKPLLKNNQYLDPFEVFVEMRRQGKRHIYYAKKFNRTRATISYALQGRSKVILHRIAKDLGMIK